MYQILASLRLNLQIDQPEFFSLSAAAPAAGAGFPPMKWRRVMVRVRVE